MKKHDVAPMVQKMFAALDDLAPQVADTMREITSIASIADSEGERVQLVCEIVNKAMRRLERHVIDHLIARPTVQMDDHDGSLSKANAAIEREIHDS